MGLWVPQRVLPGAVRCPDLSVMAPAPGNLPGVSDASRDRIVCMCVYTCMHVHTYACVSTCVAYTYVHAVGVEVCIPLHTSVHIVHMCERIL